jgi:hypothetical protein
MNDPKLYAVRMMLEKKRAMDAAWQAWNAAKSDYIDAQSAYLGLFPETKPPGPVICGTAFIRIKPEYQHPNEEIKFEFVEAFRCPTSE